MVYGRGFCEYDALLKAADGVELATPGKSGWWQVRIGDQKVKVQGSEGLRRLARKAPDDYERLRSDVYATIGRDAAQQSQEGEEDGEGT